MTLTHFPQWFATIPLLATVIPGLTSTELALDPNTISECAFDQPMVSQPFFNEGWLCTSHLHPRLPRGRGIAGLLTFQFLKPG